MKKILSNKHMIFCMLLVILLLTACSGNSKPADLLVGQWLTEYNDLIVFEEDGICFVPFTYNSSWWESANLFTVKEDGTLVLNSETGQADSSYRKVDTESEALEEDDTYFISETTLIIEGDAYTACGKNNEPTDLLVGQWLTEYNDLVVFEKDGTCSAPFTYNPSWSESAERYAVKEDGTLVLSSETGQADGIYENVDTEKEALEDDATYFVSKTTLIIEGNTYTKSN